MPAVDVSRQWVERAEALSRGVQDGAFAALGRGALWCEIEDVAGADTASDVAAETGVAYGTFRQERWVGRAWPAGTWDYDLSFSHYRATSAKGLDDDTRRNLMSQAVAAGWTEADLKKAVRAELASAGAGTTDTPHDPPDPTAFDDVGLYVAARFVEQGMARARADEFVASYGRYAGEWGRAHGDA